MNGLMPEVSHLMWLRFSISHMPLTGKKEGTSLEMQGVGLGASLLSAPFTLGLLPLDWASSWLKNSCFLGHVINV